MARKEWSRAKEERDETNVPGRVDSGKAREAWGQWGVGRAAAPHQREMVRKERCRTKEVC